MKHASMVCSSFLVATAAIVSIIYLLVHVGEVRLQQLFHLSEDSQWRSDIKPGIGFDLTSTYGVAAVSYPNGTNVAIAKIDGSTKYRETIHRLSLETSKHIAPPYDNLGDRWDDLPRQELRKWKKRLGLPASTDVGTLAEMVASLRDAVVQFTGSGIDSAVTTLPHLVAVYNEDITDAFEHVGLSSPVVWFYDHLVYETISAYAGHGLGIFKNFTNAEYTYDHMHDFDSEELLVILYTPDVLTVAVSSVKGAYFLWEPSVRFRLDFDLGSDKLAHFLTPEEIEEYWSLVGEAIQEIYLARRYDPPHRVFLLGDSAGIPNFNDTVKGVISQLTNADVPFYDTDPVFAAAKGAAEFAKRAPYTDLWWEIGWNKSHNLSTPSTSPGLRSQLME
ncbi:hypothetical protein BDZ85DRAFT_90644 [Elsinoe ampelina]|uniref:Uncharacterized protein n=1 Tax=Elsinoe ampelina TaxID=302913 RepID=A0A6A6GHU6_9PEZI|nr:hypothetical protein BDZ85DRAFT_90644 [Elsinoe ampelina]